MKKLMISTFILFIIVIIVVITVQVTKRNNEMLIEACHQYLINVKNEDINRMLNIKVKSKSEFSTKFEKYFCFISIKELNDYLDLKKYSNNEIKKKLKIVKIKDENEKIYFLLHMVNFLYEDDYNGKIKVVLFENGDRSLLLFPCKTKDRIVFLSIFDGVSYKCVDMKFDMSKRSDIILLLRTFNIDSFIYGYSKNYKIIKDNGIPNGILNVKTGEIIKVD